MGKPTGFMEYQRINKKERPCLERIKDFNDFHLPFDEETLKNQASRCMNCGIPFCQSAMKVNNRNVGCPLSNLIPEWNHLIYLGLYQEAYKRLSITAPFPEFTGSVCPGLCEACCSCSINGDAVNIKANELFLIDQAYKNNWIKAKKDIEYHGKKIAIIGSGPSGLSCARKLNYAGFKVTVYEKNDRFGGLLMYGIPNMKIEKHIIDRRIDLLREEGIEFINNTYIGFDISLEKLKEEYDEIVFAGGTSKPRGLNIENSHLDGIYYAVDFLTSTTKDLLAKRPFAIDLKDKNVVVLGGGDTGNDCLATAVRLGVKSIMMLEISKEPPLENTLPWPNYPNKKKDDYGVCEANEVMQHDVRRYQSTITSLIGEKKLEKVVVKNLSTNEEEIIACDCLLLSMGFVGTLEKEIKAYKMKSSDNKIATNDFMHEDYYVCGDMKNGQSLVVLALKDGEDCAEKIIEKYR